MPKHLLDMLQVSDASMDSGRDTLATLSSNAASSIGPPGGASRLMYETALPRVDEGYSDSCGRRGNWWNSNKSSALIQHPPSPPVRLRDG